MPTNAEAILDFVRNFPGRDDDEIARSLGIKPRQQVNHICRGLEAQGQVRRALGPSGKIANYPTSQRDAPAVPVVQLAATPAPASHSNDRSNIFELLDLGPDRLNLARVALRHCLLPNPQVVAAFSGAVFPSVRDQQNRLTLGEIEGRRVLLDDNVTPRWALLWAHGFSATHHLSGWTFAHVWHASKNPDGYTHLANLCMMPEFFGSLSDKQGPLCDYLRYHAWDRYGWRPGEIDLEMPEGYGSIEWRYLPEFADPVGYVKGRINSLSNQRVRLLRSLT